MNTAGLACVAVNENDSGPGEGEHVVLGTRGGVVHVALDVQAAVDDERAVREDHPVANAFGVQDDREHGPVKLPVADPEAFALLSNTTLAVFCSANTCPYMSSAQKYWLSNHTPLEPLAWNLRTPKSSSQLVDVAERGRRRAS